MTTLSTAHGQRARITVGDGQPQLVPVQWYKLLLRLRQLPDGCHGVVLVKDGETCQWAITNSAKVEG